MAKLKSKKKNISDAKFDKKKPKSTNPFEVHVNRQKFQVLGRKMKADVGLPGVSRAKSIKKRKETLLQEYKVKNKSNRFVDRRIGEKNTAMTNEDKLMARFTAERMKTFNKKTMYNLGDDEVLTHKGRSLAEFENDDPRSDDDDEYGIKGLNADFVEEAHFGGGLLKKVEGGRAAVIEQLIAESKTRKAEKARDKEKTIETTEKLDTDWKDLMPILASTSRSLEEQEDPPTKRQKKDHYDVLLNELKFEPRGTPQNKLKSENEVAMEEAKKLAELEEDRLRRMRGDDDVLEKRPASKHRSADDLDDGLDIEEDNNFVLTYDKEGQLIGYSKEDIVKKKGIESLATEGDETESEESDDENGPEDLSDLKVGLEDNQELDDEDFIQPSQKYGFINTPNEEIVSSQKSDGSDFYPQKYEVEKNEEYIESSQKSDESDIQPSQKYGLKKYGLINIESEGPVKKKEEEIESSQKSDESEIQPSQKYGLISIESQKPGDVEPVKKKEDEIESSQKSDESEIQPSQKYGLKKCGLINIDVEPVKKKVTFSKELEVLSYDKESNKIKTPEELDKERNELDLVKKAKIELPYTFVIADDYNDFFELMKPKTTHEQMIVIERMIKCNHPSLLEGNKIKLDRLFGFLIKYLDEDHPDIWKLTECLNEHLYTLAHFSPTNTALIMTEALNEKHSSYIKKRTKYPQNNTLNFLKLIPTIYPTSDKWHIVVTPSIMFITEILRYCSVTTRRSIATGLFLVSLLTQYVNLSKRLLPEAINFLIGVIHMACPAESTTKVIAPFKKEHKFLYLQDAVSKINDELKLYASDISQSAKVDSSFRIRCLHACFNLALIYSNLYKDTVGMCLLFKPLENNVKKLEVQKYPEETQNLITNLLESFENMSKKGLPPVTLQEKKPKALRLYEPEFQAVFDKKKKDVSEHSKLLGKYKKEMKGALREIRKDRTFLASIKFKERAESDAERMKRVKQIYSWGATQQGELNKLDRKKNRKKF